MLQHILSLGRQIFSLGLEENTSAHWTLQSISTLGMLFIIALYKLTFTWF